MSKHVSNKSLPLALGLTLGLAAFLLTAIMLMLASPQRVVSAQGPGIFTQWDFDDTTGTLLPNVDATGSAAPHVTISKHVTPTQDVAYGGVVTYTVALHNADIISSTAVLFTDTLPAQVSFGDWIIQPVGAQEANNEITWSGELTTSTTLTFAFTALHTGNYGEVVTNTAVFSAAAQIGAAEAAFSVVSAPELSLSKTVLPEASVDLGAVITYTLHLSNTGGSPATGILLTDTLPVSVTFGGFVQAQDAVVNEGLLTWAGAVAPDTAGTIIYTATVDVDYALYGATITNTAVFTSANAGTGVAQADFMVVAAPELALTKQVVPTSGVDLGDVVTYTLTLTNTGEGAARSVRLTDTLPVSLIFGSFVGDPAGAVYTVTEHIITWDAEHLWANAPTSITYTAIVTQNYALYAQAITNTVVVTAANAAGRTASATFTVAAVPELNLDKQVLPTSGVDLGAVVTYTLTLTNTGGGAARSVRLIDTLPVSLTFGSFVGDLAGAVYTVTEHIIIWDAEHLWANAPISITYTAIVTQNYALYDQSITNTVVVTAVNAAGRTASATFAVVGTPELSLSKQVVPLHSVYLGEVVTYTLTLTNTGGGAARSVKLTDTLPVSLTFGSFVGDPAGAVYTVTEHIITWNVERLANAPVSIVYTATVKDAYALYGKPITNTAMLNAQNVTGEITATATLTVIHAPVLQIHKSVETNSDYVDLHEVITYTIVLTNTGQATAVEIVLTDTLPVSLAFGGFVPPNAGSASQIAGTIRWAGRLEANGIVKIVYTATLQSAHGQEVVNRVTFTSANDGEGETAARFKARAYIYLPLALRDFSTVPFGRSLPSLPQASADGMAFVLNDKLYHAGGWRGVAAERIGQVYALALQENSPSWGNSASLLTARFGATAAVTGTRAYIIGGYDGNLLNRVDSFDGQSWRQENNPIEKALNYPTAAARGNRLYVTGGLPGPAFEVWGADAGDPLGVWNSQQRLNEGLLTRMVASDRCLYVVGGRDGNFTIRNEIYRAGFDGARITSWHPESIRLPKPLVWHAVAIDRNRLYVAGGETTGGALNDKLYWIDIDPDTCALQGAWQSIPMPGGGVQRMAWAVRPATGDRLAELYILGGQTASGYSKQVWKFVLPSPSP